MGTALIGIGQVLSEYVLKVSLIDYQQVIEAFFSHTSYPSFSESIGIWRFNGGMNDMNLFGLKHIIKCCSQLPVIIMNQTTECLLPFFDSPEVLAELAAPPTARWDWPSPQPDEPVSSRSP